MIIPKQPEKSECWQEGALNLSQAAGVETAQLEEVARCRRAQRQWLPTRPKNDFSGCFGIYRH
jgi:hypothetical protein